MTMHRKQITTWAKNHFGDQVAPNQKPIWENFVRWCGDSQAVDYLGRPFVAYHGTESVINAFIPTDTGTFGPGIYFADRPEDAAVYGEKVYAVYLNLQNPWVIDVDPDSPGSFAEDHDHPGVEAVLALPNGRQLLDHAKDTESLHFGHSLLYELQELGYDGVVATYPDGCKEYVAFEPTQVKSATHNSGNFDPNSASLNDIHSRAFERFGDSQVIDRQGQPMVVYHGTSADFERFNESPHGIFFSPDREYAERFSLIRKGEPRVIEAYLHIRNPWTMIDYGPDFPIYQMADQSVEALKARGYDGIRRPAKGHAPEAWAAFSPEQIIPTKDNPENARTTTPIALDSFNLDDIAESLREPDHGDSPTFVGKSI